MIVTLDKVPAAVETEKQAYLNWAKVQNLLHRDNIAKVMQTKETGEPNQ